MAEEWDGLRCALYGLAFLPLLFALGRTLVEACLRPWLIAGRDIERLADAVIAQHPDDPEEAAFVSEHAAWLRSAMVEQGRWRRVRKVIRRRLAGSEAERWVPAFGKNRYDTTIQSIVSDRISRTML